MVYLCQVAGKVGVPIAGGGKGWCSCSWEPSSSVTVACLPATQFALTLMLTRQALFSLPLSSPPTSKRRFGLLTPELPVSTYTLPTNSSFPSHLPTSSRLYSLYSNPGVLSCAACHRPRNATPTALFSHISNPTTTTPLPCPTLFSYLDALLLPAGDTREEVSDNGSVEFDDEVGPDADDVVQAVGGGDGGGACRHLT